MIYYSTFNESGPITVILRKSGVMTLASINDGHWFRIEGDLEPSDELAAKVVEQVKLPVVSSKVKLK
jgi:hypothetical protein